MVPVRMGLAGCGAIGRVHAEILRTMRQVQVVAVADPVIELRMAVGHLFPEAFVLSDYHELLERPDVDAVILALPNALHADAATFAFSHRKHIYLEEPLADTLAGGRAVLEAWRSFGGIGMIGFCLRFHPLILEARNLVRSGKLGDIVHLRAISETVRDLPEWKRHRSSGGGVLLNLASYHVDLIPFVTGLQIHEISCQLHSIYSEQDRATAHLRLQGGIDVEAEFTFGSRNEDRIEIHAQGGRVKFDRHYARRLEVRGTRRGSIHGSYMLRKSLQPEWDPSYANAIQAFIDVVRKGEPAFPDLEDGFHSLSLIAAAEESAIHHPSLIKD